MAQTYTYDSFGNTTNSSGSLTNFLQYTGREFDSETGLYYYRARYYDATVGRFLSEDPIRLRGGKNFYQYVRNSTPNLNDPTGLNPIAVPMPWTWGWVWGGVEGGSVWLGHAIGAGVAAGLQMTLFADSAGRSSEDEDLKKCKQERCMQQYREDIAWCDLVYGDGDDLSEYFACVEIAGLNAERCLNDQPRVNPDPRSYPKPTPKPKPNPKP